MCAGCRKFRKFVGKWRKSVRIGLEGCRMLAVKQCMKFMGKSKKREVARS